jgi:hypothetical protein
MRKRKNNIPSTYAGSSSNVEIRIVDGYQEVRQNLSIILNEADKNITVEGKIGHLSTNNYSDNNNNSNSNDNNENTADRKNNDLDYGDLVNPRENLDYDILRFQPQDIRDSPKKRLMIFKLSHLKKSSKIRQFFINLQLLFCIDTPIGNMFFKKFLELKIVNSLNEKYAHLFCETGSMGIMGICYVTSLKLARCCHSAVSSLVLQVV